MTWKLRSIGKTCHVVGVSKGTQISELYSMKNCKFSSIPESLSITINVKLDSRNVDSQFLSTLPVCTESVETNLTQSSSINTILQIGTFHDFIHKLEDSKQTNDFNVFIEAITSQSLPTSNMAWKSVMYRGR